MKMQGLPFWFMVSLVILWTIGCGPNDWTAQREKVTPLVKRHATKEEIVTVLGTNYLMYEKGDASWAVLEKFLANEPARHEPVRLAVKACPKVMLYSTAYIMTWIFLDENDKAVDFTLDQQ